MSTARARLQLLARDPRRVLRLARRVILALAVGSLLYAASRFDVVALPEGARSPLYGVHAGDRLLVDRRPGPVRPGDTVLFRDAQRALLLGRVEAPPEDLAPEARARLAAGAAWVLFDRGFEHLADSRVLGPIERERLEGRVVLVLP